jgi:hypothetical protein
LKNVNIFIKRAQGKEGEKRKKAKSIVGNGERQTRWGVVLTERNKE